MSATLLPNAKQQFFNGNGTPLAGGSVAFYSPGTTTPKNTWQDAGQTILNTNPVILDMSGEALIYGSGQYRQVVKDSNGNLIWDQLTQDAVSAFGMDIINVLAYGAVGNGTFDNSAAFTAALSAIPTGGGTLYIPPGIYFFGSAVTYTMPSVAASVSIIGSGAGSAILKFGATDGLKISFLGPFNSIHIRDLSLITTGSNAGSAVSLIQADSSIPNPANTAPSDITNVNIRGADAWEGSDYWQYCVKITSVSNVNFINNIFVGNGTAAYSSVGNGVSLSGSAGAPAVVFNFVNCVFNSIGGALIYGTWVQGVAVSNTNFTGCGVGIDVPANITGTAQLSVSNCQFNCATGILYQSSVTQTMIASSLFIVPQNGNAIDLSFAAVTSIVGNSFSPSAITNTVGNGIIVRSGIAGTPGAVITGNSFWHLPSAGIYLTSSSINCNVQSNNYAANGSTVVNAGTGNTVGGGSS